MDEITVVVERVLERARLVAERDQYQRELEQLNRSLEAKVIHQTQDLQAQTGGGSGTEGRIDGLVSERRN